MHFSTIVVPALAALVAGSAIPHANDLEGRQVPRRRCSHQTGGIHLIVAPGAGSADPPFGLLSTTAAMIMQALPGSTNVSVPYNHDEPDGKTKADQVARTTHQYLQDYQNACPGTRIALLGYSSGGIGLLNTLGGEDDPPYPEPYTSLSVKRYGGNLIAAVTYGQETHVMGQTYNYGTCLVSSPHPRSAQSLQNLHKWAGIIRDYCDADDMSCCTTGVTNDAHYDYAMRYDNDVTNYVVSQARNRGI